MPSHDGAEANLQQLAALVERAAGVTGLRVAVPTDGWPPFKETPAVTLAASADAFPPWYSSRAGERNCCGTFAADQVVCTTLTLETIPLPVSRREAQSFFASLPPLCLLMTPAGTNCHAAETPVNVTAALFVEVRGFAGTLGGVAARLRDALHTPVDAIALARAHPMDTKEAKAALRMLYLVCASLTATMASQGKQCLVSQEHAYWHSRGSGPRVCASSTADKAQRGYSQFCWYKELLALSMRTLASVHVSSVPVARAQPAGDANPGSSALQDICARLVQLEDLVRRMHALTEGGVSPQTHPAIPKHCDAAPDTDTAARVGVLPAYSYSHGYVFSLQKFWAWLHKHCGEVCARGGTDASLATPGLAAMMEQARTKGVGAFYGAHDGRPACSANVAKKLLKMLFTLATLVAADVHANPEAYTGDRGAPLAADLRFLECTQAMLAAVSFC